MAKKIRYLPEPKVMCKLCGAEMENVQGYSHKECTNRRNHHKFYDLKNGQ